MKITILLMTCLLTGCGWADRVAATSTGYARVCVDGVEYI